MKGENLAIDHDIDRMLEIKFDAPHGFALGQRMLEVGEPS
jgi:hypothetical protein